MQDNFARRAQVAAQANKDASSSKDERQTTKTGDQDGKQGGNRE